MKTAPIISLFLASLAVYTATNHGAIRSPDSEIVYRVARSLARRGRADVARDLDGWEGFGVAPGRDGRRYAIFGPAESIAAVPLIKLGDAINRGQWYRAPARIPASHYVDNGLTKIFTGTLPENRRAHADRTIVSFLNALVTALCVVVFWLLARTVSASVAGAMVAAAFYAFATPAWSYSGTFFSEPLATLLALVALLVLVGLNRANAPDNPASGLWRDGPLLFVAGTALGLSVTAHVSAVLFVPFFACYAAWQTRRRAPNRAGRSIAITVAVRVAIFSLGLAVVGGALMYYNWARFGSVWETGRSIGDASIWASKYSCFVWPGGGLWGLLFSSGKGLVWYCPAILAVAIGWRSFHRRWAALSWAIVGSAALRIVFVAARSDWHGGFSLGPRYLVMLVPFLLLPAVSLFDRALDRHRPRWRVAKVSALAAAWTACASQQLYFAIGDVFTYLHAAKFDAARAGVNVFQGDLIYRSWQYSPLHGLLGARGGPYLLGATGLGNNALWGLGTVVIGVVAATAALWWIRRNATVGTGGSTSNPNKRGRRRPSKTPATR